MPRVKRVELPSAPSRARWAAVILLMLFGIGALVYGFVSLLSANPGFSEITANTTDGPNVSGDFVFLYNLGASGVSAPTENRRLTALYTDAAEKAYRLFTNDIGYQGVHNVYYLNRHVGEEIEVDEALYRAFEQIERSGDRTLYLAPVYEAYDGLFSCADDAQAAAFDPYQNETLRAYFAEVAAFARDPEAVTLELLGENRVCLRVSPAYQAFAEAEEIVSFIDFAWMRNAFVADYLAEVLIENGYRLGTLSSYDGFSRNLDDASGAEYAFNLYSRQGDTVYPAAIMRYSGARSIVSLRGYPLNSLDFQHYYTFADGQIRTAYVDVRDGLCRNAVSELVATSETLGCAEALLTLIPLYIAEDFDESALAALAPDGLYAVYAQGTQLRYTDPALVLTDLYSGEDAQFSAQRMF